MAKTIKADSLSSEIENILKKYAQNVSASIEPVIESVAKKTVKKLQSSGEYGNRSKKYRRSFSSNVSRSHKGAQGVVFSKAPNYRLTHLLEHGHLNRNGTSRTKAYPHWEQAEEEAIREFEDELIKGIEEAGDK